MLNLAVVRSAAYYLDQVASDPTAYYLGQGEAPGRWRGRLAEPLGVSGVVDADALRRLLEGRHPADNTPLLRGRTRTLGDGDGPRGGGAATMGASAAADALGVSPRTVRRWAAEGADLWRLAQEADPTAVLQSPDGVRARLADVLGPAAVVAAARCLLVPPVSTRQRRWEIPIDEVNRLRDDHRVPATRLGYDVVFRPAKGWSVLWAVGPPEVRDTVAAIHRQAVDDALAYLESTSALTRTTIPWRGRPTRIRAKGEGLIVACFDHRESRANDPLLHTHCLVANVTRLPGGRFRALDSSGLFRQQRAADAVYQASFLHGARQRLGIRTCPGPAAFPEPDGVPAHVIREFSKRTDEIAAEVERHGSASAAARQLAALATRRAKDVAGREEELHSRWRREAAELGFTAREVARCLQREVARDVTPEELDALFTRLAGPDGLTSAAATFNRGDVICTLTALLAGAVDGPGVVYCADRFLASDAVIQVREHRPSRPRGRVLESGRVVDDLAAVRFSVPELVAIEERLMAAADERSGPAVEPPAVDAALAGAPHLSGEQASMVRAVCASEALLRPVVGLPGSGKTTATRALVEALNAAGLPVIGCAVTASAAAELGRASGLTVCDTVARTIAELDGRGGSLQRGTILIADEASMLGHRHLDRLVDHTRRAGGAVVLIGDPHQHAAVGPGSFFAWLVEGRSDVPTLATNLRQRDITDDEGKVVISLAPERQASSLFRDGDIAASLRVRDDAGLVTRDETPAALHEQLVADWWADQAVGGEPMVASSNDARERLNRAARHFIAEHGLLQGPVLLLDGREFQAGDWVVARHNDRRLRSPADPTWWVRNGSFGSVIAVDVAGGRLTVAFTDPTGSSHPVALPGEYVAAHLEHGYAVTDYGVQGRTLTRSRAVLDDAATSPGAYVATTRGRLENRVYIVEGERPDAAGVDVGHAAPIRRPSGLEILAARLAARRPDPMVHQRDPLVADAAHLAASSSTADLRREAASLDQRLSRPPTDPTSALRSAEAARTKLSARLSNLADAGPLVTNAKAIDELSQRLGDLDRSIARLRRRELEWTRWQREKAAWSRRRQALHAAITNQETRQRLGMESVDILPEP
ncbi:MAG: MobF family relaxase [Actinomycetota bacterium]